MDQETFIHYNHGRLTRIAIWLGVANSQKSANSFFIKIIIACLIIDAIVIFTSFRYIKPKEERVSPEIIEQIMRLRPSNNAVSQ
jgi:hypothetical protein